jgi:hypothetical protein
MTLSSPYASRTEHRGNNRTVTLQVDFRERRTTRRRRYCGPCGGSGRRHRPTMPGLAPPARSSQRSRRCGPLRERPYHRPPERYARLGARPSAEQRRRRVRAPEGLGLPASRAAREQRCSARLESQRAEASSWTGFASHLCHYDAAPAIVPKPLRMIIDTLNPKCTMLDERRTKADRLNLFNFPAASILQV